LESDITHANTFAALRVIDAGSSFLPWARSTTGGTANEIAIGLPRLVPPSCRWAAARVWHAAQAQALGGFADRERGNRQRRSPRKFVQPTLDPLKKISRPRVTFPRRFCPSLGRNAASGFAGGLEVEATAPGIPVV
jgi:hypothetical protein